ncbi:transcriptional antiterminator [Vibrio pectenicida]|uniref:Transcriptional antiterminator n=1 Tax=Vibrio pectenicida TaxID=62763 RepID=A0A427U789_9VIBR|nr:MULTISPECIES: Rho-binding antiterminator [Vibrio]MBU2898260.1 Rho-binding antiterminator [Vibrio hepatarius]NOH72244.1 transcriptional antiterminator [Vibrio pectenicida]RSD32555.1 transcriptional antiterminator [Vibrio pectenicida]
MISCSEYDYIEIACLYQIPIRLVTESAQVFEGKAKTTNYDDHRRECIVIETLCGDIQIPTETLVSMTALINNPHFREIVFQQLS